MSESESNSKSSNLIINQAILDQLEQHIMGAGFFEQYISQLDQSYPELNIDLKKLINNRTVLAQPDRISSPKTAFGSEVTTTNLFSDLRETINSNMALSSEAKKRDLNIIKNLEIQSRFLLHNAAANYDINNLIESVGRLKKAEGDIVKGYHQGLFNKINHRATQLKELMNKFDLANPKSQEVSKQQLFKNRVAVNKLRKEILQDIKTLSDSGAITKKESKSLHDRLYMATEFFYVCNDMNYKYAKHAKGLRRTLGSLEKHGGRVALVAGIGALVFGGLSLIPPLTPFTAPIAAACGYVALGVGMPIAIRKTLNMGLNMLRHNIAPTRGELVNTVLLGASNILSGTTYSLSFFHFKTFSGLLKGAYSTLKLKMGVNGQKKQLAQAKQQQNIADFHTLKRKNESQRQCVAQNDANPININPLASTI